MHGRISCRKTKEQHPRPVEDVALLVFGVSGLGVALDFLQVSRET